MRQLTADEVLKKFEDENEYHFHELDRKWIIKAMEYFKNAMCKIG